MDKDLDFSLPKEAEKAAAKQSRSSGSRSSATLFSFLAFAIAAVLLVLQLMDRNGGDGSSDGSGSVLADASGMGTTADLALRLERRGLSSQAANLWERHLAATDIPVRERANALFRVAKLHQDAGDEERAIEFYYRAEMEGKDELSEDVQFEINRRVQDCFERLGRFTALEEELTERTRAGRKGDQAAPGEGDDEVLAEIGMRKITRRDLKVAMEQMVDLQIQGSAASMPLEQRMVIKEQLLGQMKQPEMKAQILGELVNRELLYRMAKRNKTEEDEHVAALVEETVRQIISARALEAEVERRVQLTDVDFETYYKANKDRYREEETVELRMIVSENEEDAARVIDELSGGAGFADTASRFTIDEATRDDGGSLGSPLTKAQLERRFGFEPEVVDSIFATPAGSRLDEVVPSGDRMVLFQVDARHPERIRPFEEVEAEVRNELGSRKQREAIQDLLEELRARENVVVHGARLRPVPEEMPDRDATIAAPSSDPDPASSQPRDEEKDGSR